MAVGAPLAAGVVAGWDRRRLLALSLAWFALGHFLSALMPGFASLAVVRTLTLISAAIITPQAAAAIGIMAPPEQRGRSMTYIFMGWSLASVLGMPLGAWLAETAGWRWAFSAIGMLGGAAALAVWLKLPDGVRAPAMSLRAWRGIFSHPVLMAIVAVTGFSAAGQFSFFSYFAPYAHERFGAGGADIGLLFGVFGVFGFIGQWVLGRHIDRIGPTRAVAWSLAPIALALLLWPLVNSFAVMMLLVVPWGLGTFSSNSAQQARVAIALPALAPALVSLNTSAIYLGQAVGAASGGAVIAASGFEPLHWIALAWVSAALALSLWAGRQPIRAVPHG
jgi:predicted MFS family arabinose efflux permease